MQAHKIYVVRLYEAQQSRRWQRHLGKIPDRVVCAGSPDEARAKILAQFIDEGRKVYFCFYGLEDRFSVVVGPLKLPPPGGRDEEA